jgi:hypothetical protein
MVEAYSLQLGIAYFLIVGHLARQLFQSIKLPGAVAIIIVGFIGSFFMQSELLAARNELQMLAFFLILLRAGSEIDLRSLGKPDLLMLIIIPGLCEMTAIAIYAMYVFNWRAVEGYVLGCILFCLGEGLVVPKVCQFAKVYPGHPLIQDMMIWVPLEATFALTVFGILTSESEPSDASEGTQIGGVILQLSCTAFFGLTLGFAAGFFSKIRSKILLPAIEEFPERMRRLRKKKKKQDKAMQKALSRRSKSKDHDWDAQALADETTLSIEGPDRLPASAVVMQLDKLFDELPMESPSHARPHKNAIEVILDEKEVQYIQRPLFTNCKAEALVLVFGLCLFAMGLGEEGGVPEGFIADKWLFQPELFVLLTACGFKYGIGDEIMHDIQHSLDSIWVFGSIVLFGSIGSKTTVSVFKETGNVLPLFIVGSLARFLSIVGVRTVTMPIRSCKCNACWNTNKRLILADSAFYFTCVFAKASIQGALGSIPTTKKFFEGDIDAVHVRVMISTAAKIAIIFYAIIGCIALEIAGPKLLLYTQQARLNCVCEKVIPGQQYVVQEDGSASKAQKDDSKRSLIDLLESKRDLLEEKAVHHLRANNMSRCCWLGMF